MFHGILGFLKKIEIEIIVFVMFICLNKPYIFENNKRNIKEEETLPFNFGPFSLVKYYEFLQLNFDIYYN